MDSLSDELLLKIFKYLTWYELKTVRQCCRKFHKICNINADIIDKPKLTKIAYFEKYDKEKIRNSINIYIRYKRKFCDTDGMYHNMGTSIQGVNVSISRFEVKEIKELSLTIFGKSNVLNFFSNYLTPDIHIKKLSLFFQDFKEYEKYNKFMRSLKHLENIEIALSCFSTERRKNKPPLPMDERSRSRSPSRCTCLKLMSPWIISTLLNNNPSLSNIFIYSNGSCFREEFVSHMYNVYNCYNKKRYKEFQVLIFHGQDDYSCFESKFEQYINIYSADDPKYVPEKYDEIAILAHKTCHSYTINRVAQIKLNDRL